MVGPVDNNFSRSVLSSLRTNQNNAQGSLNRISTGNRLAGGNSSPSENALSSRLQSEIRSLTQVSQNVQSGGSLLRTAEGGLSGIAELTNRGRELSLQASNGTLSSDQRNAISREIDSITQEIDRISQSTQFNGQQLLDGSLAPNSGSQINVQAGTSSGPGGQINLNVIENAGTQSLRLDNLDISSAQGALEAADRFEQAGNTVNSIRGRIGATANRLESASQGISQNLENSIRAESNLSSANLPEEITSLRQNLTQIQTSLRTLSLTNQQNEQTIGRLLDTRG